LYHPTDDLSFIGAFAFAALGVVASVMLPVLRAALPAPPTLAGGWWQVARPYVALAFFSLLVSLLVLAAAEAADKPLRAWWEALLAGYVSDSTLQKLKQP
jgi:hypothetical protein